MILVLGKNGMLGHRMLAHLQARFPNVVGIGREDGFNAEDQNSVATLLQRLQPAVTVNCVAVIKQRPSTPALSITVNALLPHWIHQTCSLWGGKLIHFSTDCVFNGKRGNYVETDPSDSDDLYGRTKYLGEIGDAGNVLTLRTSVIGHELRNPVSLLEWFIAQNNKQIHGYTKAIYSGVTTNWLAEVVARVIDDQPLSGLYQVTSEAPISKYDLLSMVRDEYGLNIDISPDDSFTCDRSMLGEKFKKATGIVCPDWATLLREMRNAQ